MDKQVVKAVRKPRADSVRNRERVLEAAKAVFSAGGGDASLEAVARHAGVGIGTLYRHFPTREALYEAVYRREVDHLAELADELGEIAPVEAVRQWLKSNVELVATKKGMLAALALTISSSSELYTYSYDRLTKALGALLDRAVTAGDIRPDITAPDLLRALIGLCYLHGQPDWRTSVHRLVDILVDGLRFQPPASPTAAAPQKGRGATPKKRPSTTNPRSSKPRPAARKRP
ncbi:TetR/AcrR family transcriptional regulator [Methylovirgula sp. 4M-Z18]|uniref:TetR/AcrR family transcriptional regulator n=1 Tax=Methylovirgula sp. 4M-Z18 TaxID=2293567 RepID=UPI000E2EC414|nr:TetR/AcrR family transcriptional regulator [Methylovirgula sp. 4M-Z18]RFB80333.1 TetR/AcrR family transcriptional regulator [Methylovirgula sp. 4M-Z18]